MKRLIALILVVMLLVPATALASDITGAKWYAIITASNENTAADDVFTNFSLGTQDLIDAGFLSANLTDCAMHDTSGIDTAFMPSVNATYPWCFYVNNIGENAFKNYLLYTGGNADMDGKIRYFPGTGGMTSADNATLELSDNFTIEQKGWINTDNGTDKNLVIKENAIEVFVSPTVSENITATILATPTTVGLVPDSAGDYTNISSQFPVSTLHWDKVDDAINGGDGDTTYVYEAGSAQKKDAYNLQDGSISSDSNINSVTVYFRCKKHASAATAYAQPFLRLNGSETTGTEISLGNAYVLYNEALARPGGGDWQPSDIPDLQIVIGLRGNDIERAYLTQTYIVVDYSPGTSVTATGVESGEHTVKVDTQGVVTGAVQMDGAGDYLYAGNDASLQVDGDNFTVEMWVYFNDVTVNQGLFAQTAGAVKRQYAYWHSGDVKLYWRIYDAGGGMVVNYIKDWLPVVDTWYLLHFVHGGDNWDIYVNAISLGQLVDADDIGANADNTTFGLSVGAISLKGKMDEIRWYSRALTYEEIQSQWSTTSWTRDRLPLFLDRTGGCVIVEDAGTYHLFYSAYPGLSATRDICHATSATIDGTFAADPANPVWPVVGGHGGIGVLMHSDNHSAVTRSEADLGISANVTQRYWGVNTRGAGIYSEIHLRWNETLSGAWSSSGIVNVLQTSPGEWDAEYIGNNGLVLFEDGGTYYMLYEGHNGDNIYKVGLATSPDLVNWTKHGSNPVMEGGDWDTKVSPHDIWKTGATYYMVYVGLGGPGYPNESMGLAWSTDLVNWTKSPNNPIAIEYVNETDISDFALFRTGAKDYIFYEVNTPRGVYRMWCDDITQAIRGEERGGTKYVLDQTNLEGWWHLDEGSGTTSVDETTNSNDITLIDNASWTVGKVESQFSIYIDGVEQDGTRRVDVPNNDYDWTFIENYSMPYMKYHKIWIDTVLQQHIEYEYDDTVFSDLSEQSHPAYPTFRTASSDANVSAVLASFRPIEEAQAPAWVLEAERDFWDTENITATGEFTTTPTPTAAPGIDIIEAISAASGTPTQLPFNVIAGFVILAVSLTATWFLAKQGSRNIWLKIILITICMAVCVAVKVFDFWMVVFFLIMAIAVALFSRQRSVV